jgi:hypothetical protein
MATEASRRASADGVTERTASRALSLGAAVVVVCAVVLAVFSTGASPAAKNLGLVGSVASGVGLVVFGFVGRGSLAVPVWLLTVISALSTIRFSAEPNSVQVGSAQILRAGLLGLVIVVAAVMSQFAADRRFAIPNAHGQLQRSATSILIQLGSAAAGLFSVLAVFAGNDRVSYGWFFAGVASLFCLLGVMAAGLRR